MANKPELLSQLLCQLLHDGIAVILDPTERGHVAVLLEHTTSAAVRTHSLGVRLQLQTLIQSGRELEEEL